MSKIIRSSEQVKSLCFNAIEAELTEWSGDDQTADKVDIDALIKDAHDKANLIIADAKLRAREIEKEAYRKGYQEGLDEVRKEIAQEIETIKSLAEQALEGKWKVISNVEDNIVSLALEIAEKIIGEQVELKPDVIVNVAKKALLMAAEREYIQIRVNPDDLEMMRAHKEDLITLMDGIQKIEVIAERRVKRGGCIFETSAGNVDARIPSQLSQIEQSLREVVNRD